MTNATGDRSNNSGHSGISGKVALVTGAAAGIGAAVARQLAAHGARVVLLDRDEARGSALAASLGGRFMACDVSDREAWFAVVAACMAQMGVPDYVHLNAGVMSVAPSAGFLPLEALPVANYRRIVGVNLDGVVFGLQALLPHMRDRGGAITVTASMVGLIPLPVDPMYAATKHALVGLVRSVAAGLGDSALRLNAICPGGVDTAIVPDALRDGGMAMMTPDLLAGDVLALLQSGAQGEIRVRLSADVPAFAVPAPALAGR
ncbi:MAG: SDR family oxidoreductase [Gammaproteobacteria bacterium]